MKKVVLFSFYKKMHVSTDVNVAGKPKLYKRRWLMLVLFMLYAFNGSQQWAQFTIINNLITKYYNVSATEVEWTSTIFIIAYILFIIPSLYVIDIMGIRYTMVLGALGMTVGNWIKVFSVAQDRFYLVYVGQACSAMFLMLTFGLIGRFTAVWFGANEISIAGVLALLGDQIGVAFAFFFPSTLVKDGPPEVIRNGLRNMHLCVASTSSVVLALILLFFKSAPKFPPSISQIKRKQINKEKISAILWMLMKKPSLVLFLLSYGLNCATAAATTTCLNELIVENFPEGVNDAGNIGSLLMLSGMISSLLIGKILDITKKFKECATALTLGSAVSMAIFTWSLKSNNIWYVYMAGILLGIFIMGNYSIGMQLAIELTYPVTEEIATAITFLSCEVFSLILVIVYGYMIKIYGDWRSNIGITMINVVATVILLCIRVDLNRQKAENEQIK